MMPKISKSSPARKVEAGLEQNSQVDEGRMTVLLEDNLNYEYFKKYCLVHYSGFVI
jgi:hypothetical protein